MNKKIVILLFLVLIFSNCKKETSVDQTIQSELEIAFIKEGTLNLINNGSVIKTIEIEIAADDYERQNGLMNRSSMDENKGMLFIFEEAKTQHFWMKNTRIPLDIIYIDQNKKVINIAKNAEPYVETGIPASTSPAKFVLEINGGNSDKWGIKEGVTQIDWKTLIKN